MIRDGDAPEHRHAHGHPLVATRSWPPGHGHPVMTTITKRTHKDGKTRYQVEIRRKGYPTI